MNKRDIQMFKKGLEEGRKQAQKELITLLGLDSYVEEQIQQLGERLSDEHHP